MKGLHTQAASLLKQLLKFEKCGRYEEALAHLEDIWEDPSGLPRVDDFEPRAAAEIILRCGSLIGFHGHNNQIQDAQERSKNLLTEAHRRFLKIADREKTAECENYLALAYWRTGELVEAETWVESALAYHLPASNNTRIYSHLIKSLIFLSDGRYDEIVLNLGKIEADFMECGDAFLTGSFRTNLGLALKNLGRTTEALKNFELAGYYHRKSGHQIYLGTVENNLAQLYKTENRFGKAYAAINCALKIYKKVKDRTREGSSLDTKAQIYFAEGKYADALKTSEKSINILTKSENAAYLVESYSTKVKALLYMEDFSAATFCLVEAVNIAKQKISEAAAENLVREFEIAMQEKNSAVINEIFSKEEIDSENLELLLPPSIAHHSKLQGVWIKSNLLEHIGLVKDSLAVVVSEKVKRGDLIALSELSDDAVSCGFYDSDFGIVCLEGANSELQLFDEKDVRIIGKIIGVCRKGKDSDGKMIVDPINI
jgi:tetratricopeptide (TPR) repeat protein